MVFVVEVKGNWYVYRSYRLPGHEFPLHEYLGPASDYPGGLKMVRRRQAAMEEKAEQKKLVDRSTSSGTSKVKQKRALDYNDGESEQ